MSQEKVVLVDREDNILGEMEKMEAHRSGGLHRAISVLVFNQKGEMLIHQRAHHKYHSGGLWSNACCSHPRLGEGYEEAAHRRIQEEMGFDLPLTAVDKFIYKAELDGGLWEHELDQLFVGQFTGAPNANPDEVADYRYLSLGELNRELDSHPERFTEWFKLLMERYPRAVDLL